MSVSRLSNYNGKQPNNSATIKNFIIGIPPSLWTISNIDTNINVITPITGYSNLFIPNNIYIGGSIITTSDINMKTNITQIDDIKVDKLLKLKVKEYNYINDNNHIHYGFIAQELETYFPELVMNSIHINNDKEENIKSINYLEIIPLLVYKIQKMQKEIDELKK
jgi:hypothetical protein